MATFVMFVYWPIKMMEYHTSWLSLDNTENKDNENEKNKSW